MDIKKICLSLSIALILAVVSNAAPAKSGGAYEITTESIDSGGSASVAVTGGVYSLFHAIGEPGGITGLSGGVYFIQSGFLGQDFFGPKGVTLGSSLDVQNSAFTLFWDAPGDNYDSEQLYPGTKIYIATTTVLADAQSESYWNNKRNANGCEFVISTGSVNPGDSSSAVILTLNEGSTYYFRIWTLDQACNWSEISSGATVYFLQAPGVITDLKAYPGLYGRSIILTWTAPGDNIYSGALSPGSQYAIQRSTWSDVVFSTGSADTVFVSTANITPGTLQTYNLTSLQEGVTYYVRVWTADEAPSWSGLSNSSTTWATWVMLSLTVPNTWFSYGSIPTSISTDTYKAAVITNTGNVYQTYSLRGTADGDYSLAASPGENSFALRPAFNPTRPGALGDFDLRDNILSLSDELSSGSKFTINGSYTGAWVDPFPSIPGDKDRNLWFRLSTPLAISTTEYQNIFITITTQESDQ